MFILSSASELDANLADDLKRLDVENQRSIEMKKNFEAKKDALTKALNDLTPKTK